MEQEFKSSIEAMQIYPTREIKLLRFNKNSRQLSTEVVSIENYEIQISRSVFHTYPSYLCKVYFLTTLDIYKDYFKGR